MEGSWLSDHEKGGWLLGKLYDWYHFSKIVDPNKRQINTNDASVVCAQMYKIEGARARSEQCGWVAGGKREGTLGSEKQQAACSQSSADPRSCPKPR